MSDKTDIDGLIGDLSDELQPVKPMENPFILMVPFILFCALYVIGIVSILGLRADLMPKMMSDFTFFFEFGLSIMIFISATFALGWLSIPDLGGREWVKAVPVSLLMVFLFWAALRVIYEMDNHFEFALSHCNLNGLFMIFFPIVALVYSVRKGATTQPGWSAFMTILAFSALGWGALRFTCGADNFAHSFLIHFIPFVVLGVTVGLFSKKIFRW